MIYFSIRCIDQSTAYYKYKQIYVEFGMAGLTEFNNNSKETVIAKIRKRDGRVVNFEQSKISNAIYKALIVMGKPDYLLAERLA